MIILRRLEYLVNFLIKYLELFAKGSIKWNIEIILFILYKY